MSPVPQAGRLTTGKALVEMEPPAGIEPATSRLQGECSGQLSYRGACVEVSIATDVRISRSRGLPSTGNVNNPTPHRLEETSIDTCPCPSARNAWAMDHFRGPLTLAAR